MANKNYSKDDWEKEFKKWMAEKQKEKLGIHAGQTKHEAADYRETAPAEVIPKETALRTNPFVIKALIFLAFVIPIALLLYGLYINYLPFGWEKDYTLTIDEEGVISPVSSEVYITNLKGRKLLSLPDGVKGQVYLMVEPRVVLKNATLNIEIQGKNVSLGTPFELNVSETDWDYSWDFTKGVPFGLNGTAQYDNEKECVYFDAVKEQTLFLSHSENMFESGPFSVYVKWTPSSTSKVLGDYQQLIGHYNWEIYQGVKSVRFQIGRMNNSEGPFYSVIYQITPDFFDKEHELLAVYSPDENGDGYIEMYIDGQFAQRALIGDDTIYEDYNGDRNLNFGWSSHNYGKYPYYDGCIYEARIIGVPIFNYQTSETIHVENSKITIPLIGNGQLSSIRVHISQ